MNQPFSKIWIVIIGVIFIVGGILAWQWWDSLNQMGREKDILNEIKGNIDKVKTVHTETKIEFLTKIGNNEPIIGPEESFSEDFDFVNKKYQQKTMNGLGLDIDQPNVVILGENICRDVFGVGWVCEKEGESIPSTIPDTSGGYITFSKSDYPEGWDFTKKAEKIEKDLGIEEINGIKTHRYKVTFKKEPNKKENFSKFGQYFYKYILGFGPEELEEEEQAEEGKLEVEGDKIKYIEKDKEILIPLPLDLKIPVMYIAVAYRPEEKKDDYTITGEWYTIDTLGIEGEIWVEEKTLQIIKERYVVEDTHFYFDPALSDEENRKKNPDLFHKTTIEILYSNFDQTVEIEIPEEAMTVNDYLKKAEKGELIMNPRYQKMMIDSGRQAKLEDITEALYWYYVDHNKYPVSIGTERMRDKNSNVYKSLVPKYLSEDSLFGLSSVTPKDPEFSYMYKSEGQTFELSFQLESSEDVYKITRSSNLCEEETNPEFCYCHLGQLTLNSLFCKKCQEHGGMGLVAMCYEDIAFKTNDPRACDELDDSWRKANCYCEIGEKTANELLCDKCKEFGGEANDCYVEVASKTKNPQVCDKIEKDPWDPRAKEYCINKGAPPDLLIKDVTYYWSNDNDRMFNIRIENKGLSDVWGFSFNLSSPDIELSKEDSICSGWVVIRKGEESDGFVCIIKKETLSKTEKKFITVKFKVDESDEFEELDETNNEFTLKSVPI